MSDKADPLIMTQVRFSQLITHLSAHPELSIVEQCRRLCEERWVLAVQSKVENTLAIEALIQLLDECGYDPSFGYLSQNELHWRFVERATSPFLVLHLPTTLPSAGAMGVHVHTLARDVDAPHHLAGATLDGLCKALVMMDDAMLGDDLLSAAVGQIEQLPHNDHKNIPLSQQLAIGAAHHIGVLPEVALELLGQKSGNP